MESTLNFKKSTWDITRKTGLNNKMINNWIKYYYAPYNYNEHPFLRRGFINKKYLSIDLYINLGIIPNNLLNGGIGKWVHNFFLNENDI